jgi:hypothetical protein
MKVVDEHKQRRVFRRDSQERKRPGGDQVPIALANARAPADRCFQRSTLRAGNPVDLVADRTE